MLDGQSKKLLHVACETTVERNCKSYPSFMKSTM